MQALPPIKVLLIDDDEDDYIVTRDLLSDMGQNKFQLQWISYFEDAMGVIEKKSHDVILLDYSLSGKNGLEVLQAAIKRGCRIPIILLTGRDDEEVDLKAMEVGAADFLIKGQINENILERSIRYAIKNARIIEALKESEERYALAARGANDGLWDWKFKTNLIYYSPRWKTMLGYEEKEITDSPEEWFKHVHPDDLEKLRTAIDTSTTLGKIHLELEYRILKKDGREALKEIKSHPQLRKIPIVILTTCQNQEDISITYDLGGNSYIAKPVSFKKLVQVLTELVQYWSEVVELPLPRNGDHAGPSSN